MALTKTTATNHARCQASHAGSVPVDTLTDGIPSNNTMESDSAPMNLRRAVNLESKLTIWQAPSARGAVATPAPSPSVAPAAETAPAATDAPAPLTTAAPAAALAPADFTTPAAASTVAETPKALVPTPIVSDIITPKTIATPAPAAADATLAAAENTIIIQETHLNVIDVDQIASPRPEPIRRNDFPLLPSPRNKTMAPVSHAEKRKAKRKLKQMRRTTTISSTILAHAPPASPPRCPATATPVAEPEARHHRADDNGCVIPIPAPPVGCSPHPKFLGWISGRNGNCLQMAPCLQKNIADHFNMDPTDVRVGALGPGKGPGPDPIAWIISIPQEQADYLLDIGALNSDNGLLKFYIPYNNPISPFLCTFMGFTIPEAGTALVLTIIGGAIADDPAVARFVRGHRDVFPAHLTAEEAFARFTKSVYVLALPLCQSDGTYIAWNVYAHSPTHNEEAFISLQSLFGNLSIFTVWSGTGRLGKNNQGGNNKSAKGAKGKGKDRKDRKGGNGRK
ncbi:hypothetical protein B0H17DRAFT_1124964 [Mycena rosella]|uniref:Uncharacterized protein n=1 Tax=Mycena rosella TaxID=1033263 RepID=A0AAD7MAM2_MYCRO|nr:hypothetical protein B0H17DRAFT_1124964 [Mycena rosella]